MKRLLWILLLLMPFSAAQAGGKHLRIVTSIGLLADMTQQVAGRDADVTSLIGEGEEIHGYQPSPRDLRELADADVIIINGLGLEQGLQPLLQAPSLQNRVVVASREVTPRMSNAQEPDPHAWHDVANIQRYVAVIRDALMIADPAHAQRFHGNAERYLAKLAELDVWVRQQMEAVPKDKRMAITAHDAFGYFAKAYGMRFIPAQGITAEGQPSAAGLAQLIDQIKAGHVSVIFLENMENKQLAEQLADETGAVIGGELYAETLTSPQSEGGDYISLMRHNVRVLAAALQK